MFKKTIIFFILLLFAYVLRDGVLAHLPPTVLSFLGLPSMPPSADAKNSWTDIPGTDVWEPSRAGPLSSDTTSSDHAEAPSASPSILSSQTLRVSQNASNTTSSPPLSTSNPLPNVAAPGFSAPATVLYPLSSAAPKLSLGARQGPLIFKPGVAPSAEMPEVPAASQVSAAFSPPRPVDRSLQSSLEGRGGSGGSAGSGGSGSGGGRGAAGMGKMPNLGAAATASSRYLGRLSGRFGGDESGRFSANATTYGAITGTGFSETYRENFSISGSALSSTFVLIRDSDNSSGVRKVVATLTGSVTDDKGAGVWASTTGSAKGTWTAVLEREDDTPPTDTRLPRQ